MLLGYIYNLAHCPGCGLEDTQPTRASAEAPRWNKDIPFKLVRGGMSNERRTSSASSLLEQLGASSESRPALSESELVSMALDGQERIAPRAIVPPSGIPQITELEGLPSARLSHSG